MVTKPELASTLLIFRLLDRIWAKAEKASVGAEGGHRDRSDERRSTRAFGWTLGGGIAALLLCGAAVASPIGVATEVFYEYPGIGNTGLVAGTSSAFLPNSSFTVPDIGSGSFGGSAAASYLSLGTAAFSTATSSNPCCSNGATARATAVAQDILIAGALDPKSPGGFISFGFSISGKNAATVINPGPLATSARSVANVMSGPDVANTNPVNTTGPSMGVTYGHVVFGGLEYKDSAFTVNVPIFFGTPVVTWFELLSIAEGSVTNGGVYSATNSFDSTLVLKSVQLFDSAMQPVLNPTLLSQSGTIYPLIGAASPEPSPVPVPEPSSLALMGLALSAFAVRRSAARWAVG